MTMCNALFIKRASSKSSFAARTRVVGSCRHSTRPVHRRSPSPTPTRRGSRPCRSRVRPARGRCWAACPDSVSSFPSAARATCVAPARCCCATPCRRCYSTSASDSAVPEAPSLCFLPEWNWQSMGRFREWL